jgi:transposase
MQGRHPETSIVLSEKEKETLEKIARSRKAEVRLVQRAKIILFSSDSKLRNQEIGDKVGCSRQIVFKWRKRFCKNRIDGLMDNYRSGKPLKFTAEERTKILAIATKSPESEGKKFTDWSARELAKHIVKKKIVSSTHWTTISNWLRKADIRPHKWEDWLNSTYPKRGFYTSFLFLYKVL